MRFSAAISEGLDYMAALIRVMSLGGIAVVAFAVGMLVSAAQYDLTQFADMLTMFALCVTAVVAIHHAAQGADWHAIAAYGLMLGMYGAWLSPAVSESVSLSLFNLAVMAATYSIYRSRG
jgi:hypothetical protein